MDSRKDSGYVFRILRRLMVASLLTSSFMLAQLSGEEAKAAGPSEEFPEWKKQIVEAFKKPISFDLVDTPLQDVVAYFQNLTGQNLVLDPQVVPPGSMPVTLRVHEMTFGKAFEWVMRLVDLDWRARDECLFITSKERLGLPMAVQVYDCRDRLAEEKQQELIEFFRNTIGLEWEKLPASGQPAPYPPELQKHLDPNWLEQPPVLRFLDGRLIVRHKKPIIEQVDEFMTKFLGLTASMKDASEKKRTEVETIPAAKVAGRVQPAVPEVHPALTRFQERPSDAASLWQAYSEAVKALRLEEAELLCLRAAACQEPADVAIQEVLSKTTLLRLIEDVRMLDGLFHLVEQRQKERLGQPFRFRGIQAKLVSVGNRRLSVQMGAAEMSLPLNKLTLDQLFEFVPESELQPLKPPYLKAMFHFYYGSPESACEFMAKAKEAGFDTAFYEARLAGEPLTPQ